jgi:acetate---CoA ligase (ADP-forming)
VSDPLDAVFRPRAVAIVGASHDPTKRGYQAVLALQESGFAGRILPVNPRGGELLGLPVMRSIAELDPVPDLALICTPAATVPTVLEECAAHRIPAAVVLALGFAETGSAGAALEDALRAVVQRTGLRVVGPNTSGILNLPIGLNLIGARGARAGSIGLLVQSGNMALSLLNQTARGAQEGISICIGAGNQADLGVHDYLRYLERDEHTRAIAMYVESLRDGRAFFDAARDPARTKPIVLLKGGRSSMGQSAARSHTGALAGEYAVVGSSLAQAGIIEVRRTDELWAVAETLAWQPPLRGAIAVLSDGGGQATLAADALSEMKAPLARLSSDTEAALRALLGPNASVKNPVDLAGASDAAPRVFAQALDCLLNDSGVQGVLVVGLFGGYALRFSAALAEEEKETAQLLAQRARATGKTLVLHSMYAAFASEPLDTLRQARVPVLESLDVACRAVAAAAEWGECRHTRPLPDHVGCPSAADLLAAARAEGRTLLLEPEARRLVQRYGVPVVKARFCETESELSAAVQELDGAAAVLKVVAPSITHKSDVGGVRAGIRRPEDAVHAFRELMSLSADVCGVLVSPQLERPLVEVLVGARRDAQFGPILMVGLGGTLVEWQRDVAIRLLPVDREEVAAMLPETALATLLKGVRGRPAGDQAALIELILRVGETLLANAELMDIECNPVFVDADGAIAVDARAVLT